MDLALGGSLALAAFVMPLFPFLPIIAIIVQVAMTFVLFKESHWTGPVVLGWIGIGLVVFFSYSRRHAVAQSIPVADLELKHEAQRKSYSILVPLARSKDAELVLFNFIRIPDQSPLTVAETFLPESRGPSSSKPSPWWMRASRPHGHQVRA